VFQTFQTLDGRRAKRGKNHSGNRMEISIAPGTGPAKIGSGNPELQKKIGIRGKSRGLAT
jgi:hypothetical protein